ncbi:MAG: 16S rRNA (cytidine(1402)-2'-O)-methyltransferase [Chloroflexia bacterium]
MLYLVATPIGNMKDITLRALEVLKSVDLIASEDTRKTGMLLKHFGIESKQMPFHEHNEDRAGERIVEMLRYGKDVAVVTDAGTPGISDPGYSLVQLAIEAGVEVTMIPGAAAFVMAVVLSGLPMHSFTFKGFGPRKPGPRKRWMALDKEAPHTLVYYESPYRLKAFLKDALEVYGDRQAALGHELTKMFESVERGTISELLEGLTDQKLRGEHVVVIAGLGRLSERGEAESDDEEDEG